MATNKKKSTAKDLESAIDETFTFKNDKGEEKTYKVTPGHYEIPGMGVLTSLDILSDAKAQKYMVEADTTSIQEVAE